MRALALAAALAPMIFSDGFESGHTCAWSKAQNSTHCRICVTLTVCHEETNNCDTRTVEVRCEKG